MLPTVFEPETNTSYVLIRSDDYARIANQELKSSPNAPCGIFPPIDEAFGRNGWNEPKMDEYQRL